MSCVCISDNGASLTSAHEDIQGDFVQCSLQTSQSTPHQQLVKAAKFSHQGSTAALVTL